MSRFGYRAFGLSLGSDIDLPELLPAEGRVAKDIEVVRMPSKRYAWPAEAAAGPGVFQVLRQGGYLMDVPDVARYRVSGGRRIEIAPAPDADPGMVRLFTIGSALGMALHQRGILVLHGATVAMNGRARMIVGESGAGKSTLAARLGQAGCAVLGDDTMAIFPAPAGARGHWVWPGSRVCKLWSDAIGDLRIPSSKLARIGTRADKFYVPHPGRPPGAGNPCELVEILVLHDQNDPPGAAPRIDPLSGLAALQAIARNTYRPEYVQVLGREAAHFRNCAALARDLTVSRLIRPWGAGHLDAAAHAVVNRWGSDVTVKAS